MFNIVTQKADGIYINPNKDLPANDDNFDSTKAYQ